MSDKVNGVTVSVSVGDGGSPGLSVDVTGGVAGMSEREVKKYVDERIEDTVLTEDDALEALLESGIIEATTDENGALYTDADGRIIIL